MKIPTVAPLSFCKATEHSQQLCNQINSLYRQGFTTKQISEKLKIGKTAVRYYYYGIHNCSDAHHHWANAFNANKNLGHIQYSLNQLRIGASVQIAES
jgi:orotate phosphoribosyltransferase-like protein